MHSLFSSSDIFLSIGWRKRFTILPFHQRKQNECICGSQWNQTGRSTHSYRGTNSGWIESSRVLAKRVENLGPSNSANMFDSKFGAFGVFQVSSDTPSENHTSTTTQRLLLVQHTFYIFISLLFSVKQQWLRAHIRINEWECMTSKLIEYVLFTHHNFHEIYQTQGRVFHQISKHWKVGWKNEAQPSFIIPTSTCLDIWWNASSDFICFLFINNLLLMKFENCIY